jgi:nucleotide sugar dehydrogenase
VQALYAAVCEEVLVAPDWRHAALVKVVENSLRYMDIVLTNQIAMAFPDLDVAEIMRLAATKWNVPLYHPSLGIGGYCLPLAPLYLMDQAKPGCDISLLREAISWDEGYADAISGLLAERGPQAVGVLGISYAADTKIHQRSPTLRIAQRLRDREGISVAVHDPYFSRQEIEERFQLTWLDYPHELDRFSLLIVGAGHTPYRDLPALLSHLDAPPIVIDNLGELRESFSGQAIRYFEMGNPLVFSLEQEDQSQAH